VLALYSSWPSGPFFFRAKAAGLSAHLIPGTFFARRAAGLVKNRKSREPFQNRMRIAPGFIRVNRQSYKHFSQCALAHFPSNLNFKPTGIYMFVETNPTLKGGVTEVCCHGELLTPAFRLGDKQLLSSLFRAFRPILFLC
jgi:hypothetical protein